jgi:hypothetical protein
MGEQLSSNWLVAEFFTNRYRISGRLNVRQKRLPDQLNDQSTSFIELEEAYTSNIENPGDIIASHNVSVIRKRNITAIAVARREEGLAREYTYGSYFGTHMQKVFLIIPSFEVRGYLRLSSKLNLRTVLTSGTDDFIPVLDGQLGSAVRPDVVFGGGVILVNKAHVGVFCLEEEE